MAVQPELRPGRPAYDQTVRLYLASTSPARLATLRAVGIEPVEVLWQAIETALQGRFTFILREDLTAEVESVQFHAAKIEYLVDQLYSYNRRLTTLGGQMLRLAERHKVKRADFDDKIENPDGVDVIRDDVRLGGVEPTSLLGQPRVVDGLAQNVNACKAFDPSVLQCTGGKTDSCLSSAQVDALKSVFGVKR